MALTTQQRTRLKRAARNLRQARDQLRRAIRGVRESLAEHNSNDLLNALALSLQEKVDELSEDAVSIDDSTPGEIVFTVEAKDENGETVLDGNGDPITEEKVLTTDPSNQFLFEDENGETAYTYPSGDSPSHKEHVTIFLAFLSYVTYNGDMTAEEVEAIMGQPPIAPEELKNALEIWH